MWGKQLHGLQINFQEEILHVLHGAKCSPAALGEKEFLYILVSG